LARTADHHVSAVLEKLGLSSRRKAQRRSPSWGVVTGAAGLWSASTNCADGVEMKQVASEDRVRLGFQEFGPGGSGSSA
jgi:hypothetical protein